MTKRGLVGYILLSLFTCGIYSIYWYYVTAEELNRIEKTKADLQNYIIALLLGIITCGIYLIYWEYKFYEKVDALYGTNNAVLYLILSIFVTGIIPGALVQNTFNEQTPKNNDNVVNVQFDNTDNN